MQRSRTRATTDVTAVARLTVLHRRLLAGAAATVMVWAAAPAERPAHAAEVPADGGDTTLRLERLSDLPTTVRLAVGKARLVETGGPGVRSRSQGWSFVNDGLVLSEGDGVRMAGDAVENSAGAVILGLRGVLLGGADATGVLSVDNAGTILGADGVGVRITGETARLVNHQDGLIGGIGGRAAVLRGGETSVDNQGFITASSHVGLKMTADDDAQLINGRTGIIIGTGRGAVVDGHAVTVVNDGAIAGARPADDQDGAARDALGLLARGDQVVIVNRATGLIVGDDQGLRALSDRGVLIDNAGLITGADVFSEGTVSVTNRAGGEIAGDSLGLLATAPVVEVTNGGTIASADTAAIDIDAPDRATVHNTATGLVSAADAPAVQIRAGSTLVVNDGQVTGASGFLIDGDATLTNTASGTIETVDTAVFVTGTATVVNAGRIITEAGVVPADVPDAAVAVGSGGSITNLEGGVILNRHWAGVSVTDGTGTDDQADRETVIGNAGLIRSEGPGIGVRAQVAGGVTLSNARSGTIAAAGARGVGIRADRIGIENAGTIVGEGGEGVLLIAADEARLDNAGTIIGGVFDTTEQLPSGVFAEGGNLNVVNRGGGVIVGDLIGVTLLAREVAAIENAGFTNGIFVQGGDVALLTNAASGVVAANDFNGLIGDEVAVDNAGIISGGEVGLIVQGGAAGIVNTGRIDGADSAGIVSAATGTTSIVNAGIITGALVGVAVDGMVAIDNTGTISGGGTAISAAGGTVTNRVDGEIAGIVAISARGDDIGIINAGGLIKGDAVAIAVEGDGTLVDNRAGAEITAQGDTIDLMGEALIVNAGAIRSTGAVAIIVEGDAVVDNAEGGVIEAAGPAMILAGMTSLTNAGRISSIDPTFDGEDDDGVAVLAGSGGLIANTGVIDSGAGAVLIADVDRGPDPAELETVIANDGLIRARGDGTALGADVEGGIAVANSSTIIAEDGPAVDLVAADILLGNGGTIASEGGTGASLAADIVSVSNAAGALIFGGGDVGLIIQGGMVDVTNGGVIAGGLGGLAVDGDAVAVTNDVDGVMAGLALGAAIHATGDADVDNAGYIAGVAVAADGTLALHNAETGVIADTWSNLLTGTQVVLDNAGLLSGDFAGATVIAGMADITNTGRITGLEGGGLVIAVEDAVTVTNSGGRIKGPVLAIEAFGPDISIVNEAGLIDGGIRLRGAEITVDNRSGGVMIRTGEPGEDGRPASAVIDLADAGGAVITNAGLIAGTHADGIRAGGIRAGLGDDTAPTSLDVTNLAGSRIAGIAAIDAEVDRLSVDTAGFLTGEDFGVFATADDISILNRAGGEITGGISAIDIDGGFDIVNEGVIARGDTALRAPAIFALGDGDLTNAAGGRISGGIAISSDAEGSVSLSNAGRIEAGGLGIQAGGEATVENLEGGIISGAVAIAFTGSADPDAGRSDSLALINRGVIQGGVAFDAGRVNVADIGGRLGANDEGWALLFSDEATERWLTVRDGAVIEGDVLAGESNDLAAARSRADSVATFEGAGHLDYDLAGFGLIEKQGAGSWFFAGDLLAAAFDVNEGGVHLDGRFTGDAMTVGTAGRLSGNGTIDGELVNEGIVAPGRSIGTLTVTADYTQTDTGTLAMEYADDGAGGALTDRLVVGGAADIQGGTLALTSFDGSTPRYASAALLTAAGGVTGGFDRVETDRAGLLGGVLIEGDVIEIRLIDTANGFRALAETETARGVAGVLEAQALTATGDRDVLLTRLAALDDAGAAAALGDLAGTEYAGHWRYLRSTGRAFVDGATQAGAAGHRGAWITGFGNAGRTSGEDAVGDVRWRSAGTAVGIDFAVGEDARLGLAAGVTDGRMSARDRDAGIDTTGWHVGAYGAVPAGPVMLDAAVAFTRASSDASRSISGTGRTASGSFDTDQITASIGVSTDIVVPGAKPGTPEAAAGAPAWTVTPMLRLTFDHQRSDDVTETGAGAAALRVEGATVQGLEAFAGVRFGASFGDAAAGDVVVRPSFTLGIGQELLDRDNSLMAGFADDPANRFRVNGVSQGRTTGRFGAEVAVDVSAGVTIGAAYAGSIDDTGDDHRLTAGLRLSW